MPPPQSLGLSITNPLVLYRALVATKKIKPDPAQHRLALQLQKLYFRLKDYSPEVEYRYRLEKIGRSVGRRKSTSTSSASGTAGFRREVEKDQDQDHGAQQRSAQSSAEHRTPSSPSSSPSPSKSRGGILSALLSSTRFDASTLALTRTTPLHTSALQIDSPLGLLLYGEVGRGKSMLLDLLYTSLPSRKKRRWHFNTFMLDLYRRIELSRLERVESSLPDARPRSLFGRSHHQQQTISDHEHVMLTLARDTICDSPILFLDEFQMPDRTASKLVGSFLTSFFHLGGVLVASSNRMPEELSKAAGIEFGGLQRSQGGGGGGGIWGLGWGLGRESEGERSAKTDFGLFLEVLRARCEVWEMEGERDWRREGDDELVSVEADADDAGGGLFGENTATTVVDGGGGSLTTPAAAATSISTLAVTGDAALSADAPPHYHVAIPSTPSSSFETDLRTLNPSDEWTPMTLTVYARHLTLPSTNNGILKSTFSALCTTYLGPADYVSLCSTFHTLILTDVPVLTLTHKNEARRFITLLDALYEARCRLLIEAAAPPDKLFFPETRGARRGAGTTVEAELSDSITSEAFSEIYQDSMAPFRPNVSVYTEGNIRVSEPEPEPTPKPSFTASLHNPSRRSVLADEDADFGPTYGNGRGSGISRASSSIEEAVQRQGMGEGPDFTSTSALTGEDERFAYKRARSRLWEMCGRKWWDERVSVANVNVNENDMRDGMGWWRPVGKEGRTWERFVDEAERLAGKEEAAAAAENTNLFSEKTRAANESDPKTDSLFRHGASPFRNSASPPPKFGWQHAWGMMRWGKKAGDWGKGIDAFTDTTGSSSQDNEPKAESGKARREKK
ncbi:hypothetical protein H2202_006663 [Exophiala xenobiotica]|nr:hypothetical protein H2202_006663 [Exophiala xenobiotica]KAK5235776.1 hypothetical protein LTR47_003250 [Exophiala xenobiotica]KAK5244400.1 hypothetical protein LTS06_010028 [Exophiala xenobiotica]KAK5327611.1 hypothetical protein LTR93_002996 [Exophiala xenobiotica]KAK5354007.1 hypothetical protein LTR61_002702 [Exophiala xenobiotica]